MVKDSPWASAIRLCGGDANMGILLHRLEFFHDKTTNINRAGDPVTIRTYAELAGEFGWTDRQAKTVVTKLKKAGIVKVTYGPHPTLKAALRCCHICLTGRTESVSPVGQDRSDPLCSSINESINEETAVPTTLEVLGKNLSRKDFPGSKKGTPNSLYALWRDCLSEAYPGEPKASWGRGRRAFAKQLIGKYEWDLLIVAMTKVLMDWPGFRLWLSDYSEVKCKADRPDLLFLLKHSDLMMQYTHAADAATDEFELEDYKG